MKGDYRFCQECFKGSRKIVSDMSSYIERELKRYQKIIEQKRKEFLRKQAELLYKFVCRVKNDFDRKEENFVKAYISDIAFTMGGIEKKAGIKFFIQDILK